MPIQTRTANNRKPLSTNVGDILDFKIQPMQPSSTSTSVNIVSMLRSRVPGSTMTVSLEFISPETADQYLEEFNTRNRTMSEHHTLKLTNTMKAGKFKENGDTICFDREKRLQDGQKRLKAIVKSGIGMECIVVRGLDPEAFWTKDTHQRRSAADTLVVLGDKRCSRELAAALLHIERYKTGRMRLKAQFDNEEVVGMSQKYERVIDSVIPIANSKTKGLAPVSILAACHYLFSEKDKDAANAMVQAVITGANLSIGDPYLVLRQRLESNRIKAAKLPTYHLMGLIIKAWNAKRSGRIMSQLKLNEDEAFPVIR